MYIDLNQSVFNNLSINHFAFILAETTQSESSQFICDSLRQEKEKSQVADKGWFGTGGEASFSLWLDFDNNVRPAVDLESDSVISVVAIVNDYIIATSLKCEKKYNCLHSTHNFYAANKCFTFVLYRMLSVAVYAVGSPSFTTITSTCL